MKNIEFKTKKERLDLEKLQWLEENKSRITSTIEEYQKYTDFWRRYDEGNQLLNLEYIKFGAKKFENWARTTGDLLHLEFFPGDSIFHSCIVAYSSSVGSTIFRFNDVIIYTEAIGDLNRDGLIEETIGNMLFQHHKKSECSARYGETFRTLEELIYLKRIEKNKIYNHTGLSQEEQIHINKLLKFLSLNNGFYDVIENEYLNSSDMDELQAILHILSMDNALCRLHKKPRTKEASFVDRQARIFDYYREQYSFANATKNFDKKEQHRKQRIYW